MIATIFRISLIIIGSLVGLFAIYLLVVGIAPIISAPKQPITVDQPPEKVSATTVEAIRQDVNFEVDGTALKAWLYLPQNAPARAPCIVLGNGFGGTREMGLAPYAERFQTAGFAALVFDYRHFGASEGEPRQLIWIPCQLEDWAAAIRHARSRPEIDPDKIALWGTSTYISARTLKKRFRISWHFSKGTCFEDAKPCVPLPISWFDPQRI